MDLGLGGGIRRWFGGRRWGGMRVGKIPSKKFVRLPQKISVASMLDLKGGDGLWINHSGMRGKRVGTPQKRTWESPPVFDLGWGMNFGEGSWGSVVLLCPLPKTKGGGSKLGGTGSNLGAAWVIWGVPGDFGGHWDFGG